MAAAAVLMHVSRNALMLTYLRQRAQCVSGVALLGSQQYSNIPPHQSTAVWKYVKPHLLHE